MCPHNGCKRVDGTLDEFDGLGIPVDLVLELGDLAVAHAELRPEPRDRGVQVDQVRPVPECFLEERQGLLELFLLPVDTADVLL